jgi:tetratricopeptide (TPR) repeat protein
MKHRLAAALIAVAVLAAGESILLGQQAPLSWRIQVVVAESEPWSNTRRLYQEPDVLELRLLLTNDSVTELRIDQPQLRNTFGLRVDRDGELPVTVEWRDRVVVTDEVPEYVDPSVAVALQPRRMLAWTIVVRRQDGGRFTAGLDQITAGFLNLRDAVRTRDGSRWAGRVLSEGFWPFALRVQPGVTPAERARYHVLVGAEAQRLRQFEMALLSYQRAAEIDPTDGVATVRMADMFLRLARYKEAIPLYEAASTRGSSEARALASFLAQAYVGVGDDTNAVRVLRAAGRSEEQVSTELDNMRQHAAENPSRSGR